MMIQATDTAILKYTVHERRNKKRKRFEDVEVCLHGQDARRTAEVIKRMLKRLPKAGEHVKECNCTIREISGF